MLITLTIIALALGLFLGYKAGAFYEKKLTSTLEGKIEILENQVRLLQEYSAHWAAESTNRYHLLGQIAQQQTTNTSTQIQTVIQLLQTIQKEEGQNLSKNENEKISQLINQAKQVIQN